MALFTHDRGGDVADLHQTLLALSQQNKLDVATFMQHALYHPQGYYSKTNIWGRHGDYITSPHISQVFGEMIALWVVNTWHNDGCPHRINLVELGPGNGTLMQDMLRTFRAYPNFEKALQNIHLVDIKAHNPFNNDARIRFHASIHNIVPNPGDVSYVVSNEFFDALPIQQILPDGKLQHIDWHYNAWCFRHPNDNVIEDCPDTTHILQALKTLIGRQGRMLAIDYGHVSSDPHPSTLQALHQHKYVSVLSHVGEADITSHVNFHYWIEQAGGQSSLTHQGTWLRSMGAEERTAQLAQHATAKQANDLWVALARLTDPAHMGTLFKVWEWHNSDSSELLNQRGYL